MKSDAVMSSFCTLMVVGACVCRRTRPARRQPAGSCIYMLAAEDDMRRWTEACVYDSEAQSELLRIMYVRRATTVSVAIQPELGLHT